MHLISYEISLFPIFVKLIQCEYLLLLVVIQIPINSLALEDRLFAVILDGRVIVYNLFILSPGSIQ